MPPFDFDDANPADDAVVSQHPANERASRKAITDAFEVEHHEGTGRHQIPGGTTAARDGITDWQLGSFWWNTSFTPPRLQRQKAAATPFDWTEEVYAAIEFPAGTRMVFDQDAAPTGWTRQNITGERLIKLAGSGDTGQTEAGTWTISGLTVASHVLTLSQLPTAMRAPDKGSVLAGGNTATLQWRVDSAAEVAGGGTGHTHGISHGGAWRPAHRILIIASKD